jgi:hypothetical protein
MAMTKKEQEKMEELLIISALRYTTEVQPDIQPPPLGQIGNEIRNGYLYNTYTLRITEACTSSIYHNDNGHDRTTSQGSCSLYSTKLLALKAMRNEAEKQYAKKLREIDKMIEKEMELLENK